ncbi:MAG: hypothetical protein ABFD08_07460 [Syntrophomonas sp.]
MMGKNIFNKERPVITVEETEDCVIESKRINGFLVRSIFPKNCPDGDKNLDKFFKELRKEIMKA